MRLAILALILCALPLHADPAPSPSVERAFKLSLGDYYYDDRGHHYQGVDVNLRYRRDDSSLWLGYYEDPVFGRQGRAGFDTAWTVYDPWSLALLPSLQVATRDFVGGSVAAQVGSPWFAQVGIGRTNLKPYANLNFDPNDAISVAVGYHGEDGRSFTLSTLRDDRLHTGQRHHHAILQWPLGDGQRLTLDLLRKTGAGDGGHVATWGGIATYDFPRWFLRLAYDPQQNFGTANVIRLSTGLRF